MCTQGLKRKKQNFLDDLSNSGPAVRLPSEGRATGPPEDPSGITWLIENRGHPYIKQNQIGLEGTQS